METHRRPGADGSTNVLTAAAVAHLRSRLPPPELDVLVRYHPNLLIVGEESAIAPTVLALMSDFYPCVCRWPQIPTRLDQHTTLIVDEVGSLASGSLEEISEWLDTLFGRVQIISTSSAPLIERVDRGTFPASLYYRLNTVLLTVEN